MPNNPSCVTLNETIRNILEKKQETAKKTFNLFSEKKSRIASELNEDMSIMNDRYYSK